MEQTVNGFKISDEDLKLRGPGEFYGKRQHGFVKTKLANFSSDKNIILQAKKLSKEIIHTDSELKMERNRSMKHEFTTNFGHMLDFINIG